MKDIDYTTVIVEDVLGLISSDKNPWPSNFTKVRKLKLLDSMLDYCKANEMYEHCKTIQSIKDKVLGESNFRKKKK